MLILKPLKEYLLGPIKEYNSFPDKYCILRQSPLMIVPARSPTWQSLCVRA